MNYLQLTTADVTKLKCNLVLEAEKYFKSLKYTIDPSNTKLLKAFNDFLYSSNSCVTDDDICYLKEVTEIKVPTPNCDGTFNCVDINAEVSFTENNCEYITYVNPLANLQLVNNATTFAATTDVSWNSCDGGEDLSFTSSSNLSYSAIFGFDISVQHLLSSQSYIRYLNLTKVNSAGAVIGTFVADLTPGSIYYSNNASCPGCSAVNTSHVELGNANFVTAFSTLLNNISLAEFGQTGRHNIQVVKTGAFTFDVYNTVRHNPTVNIFGLDFSAGLVKVYNPNTASTIQKNASVFLQTPATFTSSINITTPCGALLTPTASGNSYFSISTSTNFFKLVLNSIISNTPLATSTPSVSCKKLTYTGTYNPAITPTKGWYEDATLLNTTNVLTITESGDYSFKVETASGCEDVVNVVITEEDLQ